MRTDVLSSSLVYFVIAFQCRVHETAANVPVETFSWLGGFLVIGSVFWIPSRTHTHTHKVRMQSGTMESYSKRKSCAKFFRQIYREEGVRGLYRVSEALPIGP